MKRGDLVRQLAAAGVPDPAGDLRRLWDWAYAQGAKDGPQTPENPNEVTLAMFFDVAVPQRLRRVPVSRIKGCRDFWRHEFSVTPGVLDPRPETETLVACALEAPFERLLDLGTGSGCIAISLLADRPKARGVATDLSDAALRVAAANARRIGVSERLELVLSDWFAGVQGGFDLIVSNPPYIAAAEMAALAPEVRLHEPRGALTDEADGLGAYRAIAARAAEFLVPGGRMLLEIGPTQAAEVADLLARGGLAEVTVHPDLDGRDRVICARSAELHAKKAQNPRN